MTISVDLFGRPAQSVSPQHQLALPLYWRERGEAVQDVLVGMPNREAVDALKAWRNWPYPIAVLYGAPKSGKSVLAHWFRRVAEIATVVDPAIGTDEAACFHACNRALAGEGPLLFVVAGEAGSWQPYLCDLATRVRAAQQLVIGQPDTEFFAILLQQRVAEAAHYLSKDAARHIAERSERSYHEIDLLAERLINHARRTGQGLTLAAVRGIVSPADADAHGGRGHHQTQAKQ